MVTDIYLVKKFPLAFFVVTIYKEVIKRNFSHRGAKL